MDIQVVFVGFSEAALKAAKMVGGEKVYAIHSGHEKSAKWVDELKNQFGAKEITVDAYDVLSQLRALLKVYEQDIRNNKNEINFDNKLIINLTSATKYGQIAIFLFSEYLNNISCNNAKSKDAFKNCRFVYLEEATGKLSEFPFHYYFALNRVIAKVFNKSPVKERGKKPNLQKDILENLLKRGSISLMDLEKELGKSKPTVSIALQSFINSGLVKSERKGVKIVYSIDQRAASMLKAVKELYS